MMRAQHRSTTRMRKPGPPPFVETHDAARPLGDLGLMIDGSPLAPLVAEVRTELANLGLSRLNPAFYLSTEWGVAFGSVAIGIPFYLAIEELTRLHAERNGHVEGFSAPDILRYLRHEAGHVVNYAFRLYDDPEWATLFGPIEQPYDDDYRPVPFDLRYVRHLPGWYAQKHPDEDWAETFAVCVTPPFRAGDARRWRADYAAAPVALRKLEYCDAVLRSLVGREPLVNEPILDEDVAELRLSIDDHYGTVDGEVALPPLIDEALLAISEPANETPTEPLAVLVRREERAIMAEVYRWSGHFPERTRGLLRHLAKRADASGLSYAPADEQRVLIGLTAFVTGLGMTFVRFGRYAP